MPKSKVVKNTDETLNYFSQTAVPNLKTYFGRVVKGQSEIYNTPFAKGESTPELLEEWNKVLVSINDEWPTLYEFEKDMASKVGPMSVMLPLKDRMDDIRSYYEGIHLPSTPISRRAIKAVLLEWRPERGLAMYTQGRTVYGMKRSTNSGSPYFTKRRQVLDETYPCEVYYNGKSDAYNINQILPEWNGYACAILGWRGQEGGYSKEDVKQRVVWMFPFGVNINELQVYQPLITAAQRSNLVPAWVSMEAVDKRITAMFDTKASDDLVICTDFTKFDQHFNSSLQSAARQILVGIMNSSIHEWIEDVFPIKYEIPMMYDIGKVISGSHGMGSGSGGTNADETLAHRALQYEAAILNKAKLNPNSQCLGDDGVLTYPGITVKDVTEAYSSHGLEMNESKQYASRQDCIYLRRWHHQNYRIDGVCAGVYSTNRALGRLRYLERFQDPEFWGPEAVALRQLSILENVKYHPLRDQFAQFCMKRDKYRLGIDIPGFMDHLDDKVREAIDHMPDFMGYTKTLQSEGDPTYGINSWWIVNYLRQQS